jgi:hypothetical protein
MKIKSFLTIIVVLIITSLVYCRSQEIKATVTVNMEQLSVDARNYVSTMKSDIERYINNQQFTETEWKGDKIPVDITIYLSGGTSYNYSARFYFASRRILDAPTNVTPSESIALRMIENNWSFTYGMGVSLTFNPLRFDPLSSLIDFYMLLIIGYDLDSYSELGGNAAFSRAKNLVQMGAMVGAAGWELFSHPGDITKFNLISEITDMRYEEFRRTIVYYYLDGLDRMAFKPDSAKLSLESTVERMADFKQNKLSGPSVLMQVFFDTKAPELASIFNGWENKRVFRNLKYLDVGNSTLYDDAQNGKMK